MMDSRVDRLGCEEGEELCDVCIAGDVESVGEDADFLQAEQATQGAVVQQQQRIRKE